MSNTPDPNALPVDNLQWEQYLAQLDLNNPAMAQYLRSVLGAEANAVPTAGQYTTSMDYGTLNSALRDQYVTEVIKKYQGQLGDVSDLVASAVSAGYLTAEQGSALQSQGFTQVGSLQQKYASQGGLRTLAGPYQAERTQLLQQAMADMGTASQKASSDAYSLAQQTTGLRVQALGQAGNQAVGLVGHGVSRLNAKDALAAAGDQPPLDLPVPPQPQRPSWWEALLPALGTAGIAAATRLLTQPSTQTPEQKAQDAARFKAESDRLAAEQAQTRATQASTGYNIPDRPQGPGEHGGPYQSLPESLSPTTVATSPGFAPDNLTNNPYAANALPMSGPNPYTGDYGFSTPNAMAYGANQGGASQPAQDSGYSWNQPMPQYTPPTSNPYGGDYGYTNPSQSANDYGNYSSTPDYSQYNDYGGWGGSGVDYSSQSYYPDYTSYNSDYAY